MNFQDETDALLGEIGKVLRGLRVDFASLVDSPANPGARVALFKRAQGTTPQLIVKAMQSPEGAEAVAIMADPSSKLLHHVAWERLVEIASGILGADTTGKLTQAEAIMKAGETSEGKRLLALNRSHDRSLPVKEAIEKARSGARLAKLGYESWGDCVASLSSDLAKAARIPYTEAAERIRKAMPNAWAAYNAERGW